MLTVHEVSELASVSVRTLRYYDKIGLLRPAMRTEAGYRMYGDDDLARLQQILLFRELEFPLKDIRRIIDDPAFDQTRALDQQIELLKLKREHIEGLITLAQDIKEKGATTMGFSAFDTSKIDDYTRRAKESWGQTPEWEEYEVKSAGRTHVYNKALGDELLDLFKPFGTMAAEGMDPASADAQAQAQAVQAFISEHYYTCSDEVFAQLGRAYGSGGEFTSNINAVAGEGAAEFAAHVIEALLS